MSEVWHLAYHYLTLSGENSGGLACLLARFERQLEFIRALGYTVLSLSEVTDRMNHGKPMPEKLVTISFDDNLRDGYTRAFPLLAKFGFPATFFAITSTFRGKIPPVIKIQMLAAKLGGLELQELLTRKLEGTAYQSLMDPKRYDVTGFKASEKPENRRVYWVFCHIVPFALQIDLGEEMFEEVFGVGRERELNRDMFIQTDEMREMLHQGMDIGSHTVNHPLLSICGLRDVVGECEESRKDIADLFGYRATVFGWPFGGKFPGRVVEMVSRYYGGAYNFLSKERVAPQPPYDPHNMPRLHEANAELFTELDS